MTSKATVFTAGHSTRSADELVAILDEAGIELLVDIRRQPYSRRHPQFGREALQRTLAARGIRYRHAEDLGGLREPRADSPNTGIANAALRGYADHTASSAFVREVAKVLAEARAQRTAVMCAEASPVDCHRRLLSDWLVAHGHEVVHLLGAGRRDAHVLDPGAQRDASGALVWHPRQRRMFD